MTEQATEKLCRKCKRLLPLERFRRGRRKDGTYYYYSPCKDCYAFQQASWYARNKTQQREKHREAARQWRATHPGYHKRFKPSQVDPEKVKAAKQRYRDKHRDEINAKARTYYAANRDKVLQQKRAGKIRRAYKRQMGTQEGE